MTHHCALEYLPKWFGNLYPHNSLHVNVYISSIHNHWKRKATKCRSVGAWVRKLWYVHAMACRLTVKRHVLLSHARTWIILKRIFTNERSRSEKVIYCTFSLMWHSGKGKTIGNEKSVTARGGAGEVRAELMRHRGLLKGGRTMWYSHPSISTGSVSTNSTNCRREILEKMYIVLLTYAYSLAYDDCICSEHVHTLFLVIIP